MRPDGILPRAREVAEEYREKAGKPISRDKLKGGVGHLDGEGDRAAAAAQGRVSHQCRRLCREVRQPTRYVVPGIWVGAQRRQALRLPISEGAAARRLVFAYFRRGSFA